MIAVVIVVVVVIVIFTAHLPGSDLFSNAHHIIPQCKIHLKLHEMVDH
jgi:hypothetical protein